MEFHGLVRDESAPLHARWDIDVITFGQSQHNPDFFYLIRAYHDHAHLEYSHQSLYGSTAWRDGPREALVSLIITSTAAVFPLAEHAIEHLRKSNP